MEKFVIVSGNPIEGFQLEGPFDDREQAIEYADRQIGGDWWIAPLTPPTPL